MNSTLENQELPHTYECELQDPTPTQSAGPKGFQYHSKLPHTQKQTDSINTHSK